MRLATLGAINRANSPFFSAVNPNTGPYSGAL